MTLKTEHYLLKLEAEGATLTRRFVVAR